MSGLKCQELIYNKITFTNPSALVCPFNKFYEFVPNFLYSGQNLASYLQDATRNTRKSSRIVAITFVQI
jgi:hypothetical protein